MLKQLISLVKVLWANIWSTAEPYIPKMPDGFVMPIPNKKLAQKNTGIMAALYAGLAARKEEDRPVFKYNAEKMPIDHSDEAPKFASPTDNIDTIRREDLLKAIIKSLNDEGYYDFDIYWEQGMYHIAIPNRVIGNIYACGTWQQFFIMYKLVMLKWGYKRSELEFIEPCSEQSVILNKMDEISKNKSEYFVDKNGIPVMYLPIFEPKISHPYPSDLI